jgi:hypothetical protein
MRIRLAALLLATLTAAVLAGCGGASRDGTAQPGGNVSGSPPSGSASGSGSPPVPPSGRGSQPPASATKNADGAELTLTGRPEEGVESGCLVLRSGDTLYLLLGGDRQMIQSGRPVVVRGKPNPGILTTCQQGIPFEVSEVRLA